MWLLVKPKSRIIFAPWSYKKERVIQGQGGLMREFAIKGGGGDVERE